MSGRRLVHLVKAHNQILERVHIGNLLQLLPETFDDMLDEHLDVLAFDKLKELQASGVEEVVSWHSIVQDLQDGLEKFVLNNLPVVCFVVYSNDSAEVFERSYTKSARQKSLATARPTQFEMLLRTSHQLANARSKAFREDEVFAAIRMLSDEEA